MTNYNKTRRIRNASKSTETASKGGEGMFGKDPKINSGPEPGEIDYTPEIASGVVYQNGDVSSEPNPERDDIVAESGDEIDSYPEGAYQTWNPREREEFSIDEVADTVHHFFSDGKSVLGEFSDKFSVQEN